MHIMKYYSAMKNEEILLFATTWVDGESIMLNEISRWRKTCTVRYHLYAEPKNLIEKEMRFVVIRGSGWG